VKTLLLAVVSFWQRTFAWIVPVQCRFHPSCSHYFAEAVERHGAWKGAWLGIRRLLRCQPFGGSGYDPVP
jgi:putative membrane protein insertion efficiency factor